MIINFNKKSILIIIILLITASSFAFEPLSDGFKDIKLGMSKEEVKSVLKTSNDFIEKKEEILVIRIEPDTEIISTEGRGFIIYGYFHFDHDQLFQIFLKLDEKKLGYYNILRKLTNKLGNPSKFSPKRASWENEKIKIVLEKPCNLKYLYLPIWNGLVTEDNTSDIFMKQLREKFLDDL